VLALHELDRHLDHPQLLGHRPPGQVDLEAVALAGHGVQVELVQRLPAERPEAAGGVAQPQPEHQAHVGVPPSAEQLPGARPVDDRSAAHPPGAEDQVGVRESGEQVGQLLGLVRAVGVHLDEHVVAALQPPAEAGQVGAAEALLPDPVQDVHLVVLGREAVSDLAGAVGAGVVDDQHVRGGHR
jgi:hypothetical protein